MSIIAEKIVVNTSVIIVGAGPAGSMASIFLTKAGIYHVLIDKDIFPRDKVCGDGCSGKTVFVLKKANPAWADEVFENKDENLSCGGVIFSAPNGRRLTIPFTPPGMKQSHAAGFVTPRLKFDYFLFKKAASDYAAAYEGVQLQKIERSAGEVHAHFLQAGKSFTAIAPLIIGADGDKSMVRKMLMNNELPAKSYYAGLRSYYHGVTGFHPDNFIELHFLPELLPGYFWIFPLANGMANVGVGMPSDKIREKKLNLRAMMLDAIKNNPDIKDRFNSATAESKIQGWGLPMCMNREPVSGDHFLLTGDAAALIDPFTGEGIGNALYSGMLAAEAAVKMLKEKKYDASFAKEQYDDVLFKRVGDELRLGAFLQRLSRYSWLFNIVVKKANKSVTLNTALTSVFTDLDLRNQIRKPSFYWKIIRNK